MAGGMPVDDDTCEVESAPRMVSSVGIGGYQSLIREVGSLGEKIWQTDASFLTGSVGAALALLAGVSNVSPDWDRLLLCDVPASAPTSLRSPDGVNVNRV